MQQVDHRALHDEGGSLEEAGNAVQFAELGGDLIARLNFAVACGQC
jgi:hypothetical protein